jgi:hypothetical protein
MRYLFVLQSLVESFVITAIVVTSLSVVQAQVRSSTNYHIQSESINVAGDLSTSASYALESTAGEVATGDGDSSGYRLRAGYQQMQEVFISLSDPGTVEMSGALGGLTGGESNGSTTVTVVTDSPGGYQLLITAASAPAMRKGSDTIADYTPASTPNPDFIFTTANNEAHFALAPFGIDMAPRFQNNGSLCASGSGKTPLRCWVGASTSPQLLAQGAGANHPDGATTTLQFKVGIGSQVMVPAGIYIATTTLTALSL